MVWILQTHFEFAFKNQIIPHTCIIIMVSNQGSTNWLPGRPGQPEIGAGQPVSRGLLPGGQPEDFSNFP